MILSFNLKFDKMFNTGFLSFSDDSIFLKSNSPYFSVLPRYLFDVYLRESDIFLSNIKLHYFLCSFLNPSSKINQSFWFRSQYSNYNKIRDYTPVKLDLILSRLPKVRCVSMEKYLFMINKYKGLNNFPVVFRRNFSFARYLNFYLFGFLSGLIQTQRVFRKYLYFIRSNMHLDINEPKISILNESSIYFLGFEIKLNRMRSNCYSSFMHLSRNKKYLSKMFSRLAFYKRKNLRILFNRISFELIKYVNNIAGFQINRKILEEKKLWMLIFQKEAVRSLRISRILFTSDNELLLSKSLLLGIKDSFFNKPFIYFFDSYILKMQLLISEVLREYNYSLDSQLVPVDIFLENFFSEYKKFLFFLYNEVYFKNFFQNV